jgi:cytochrome c oxidase cbb3-type subunit 3
MKPILLNLFSNSMAVLTVAGFLWLGLPFTVSAGSSGNGQELYQYYCAQCHGANGDGKGINATEDLPTQPKDFTSPKNLPVFSDQQIVNTITHGGPKEQLSFIMPAWGDILSTEEIDLLRERLREICKCKYDPKAAAAAAAEAAKKE